MDIAIVIPCFKRVDALSTLCDSLLKADYGDDKVSLIFSVDYAEGSTVPSYTDSFLWPYGEKVVIRHKKNIGLRNNILFCGDLTERYHAVIILEDDLEVMPGFYQFAKAAAEFYYNDDRVAGVSIYQYFLDEIGWGLFLPIDEGYDIYFVKWASSWGQLWTRNQWSLFRQWYANNEDISSVEIPSKVKEWRNSWKKYYIAYLTDTNKYFVFPRKSFVYNGNKGGGVHSVQTQQVLTSSPLELYRRSSFVFGLLDEVQFKYDSFFQLESRIINANGIDYTVDFDLMGEKEYFHSPYVITSRLCKTNKIIESFDAGMLPLELNILYAKQGDVLFLIRVEDIERSALIPYNSFAPIRKTIRNWRQLLPLGFKSLFIDIKSSAKYKLSRKCK